MSSFPSKLSFEFLFLVFYFSILGAGLCSGCPFSSLSLRMSKIVLYISFLPLAQFLLHPSCFFYFDPFLCFCPVFICDPSLKCLVTQSSSRLLVIVL